MVVMLRWKNTELLNIVENGTDGQGGSYTSEMALELRNPWGCVVIEGLTAGATG